MDGQQNAVIREENQLQYSDVCFKWRRPPNRIARYVEHMLLLMALTQSPMGKTGFTEVVYGPDWYVAYKC